MESAMLVEIRTVNRVAGSKGDPGSKVAVVLARFRLRFAATGWLLTPSNCTALLTRVAGLTGLLKVITTEVTWGTLVEVSAGVIEATCSPVTPRDTELITGARLTGTLIAWFPE